MSEAERLAQALQMAAAGGCDGTEPDPLRKAAALLRSQAAEIEALRADAERYVTLIEMSPSQEICFLGECYFGKSALDAAIDAARNPSTPPIRNPS